MKLRNMKKVLAAVLSTTMVVGMSMTVFAAPGEVTSPTTPTNPIAGGGSISAPIYSYDITHVVVPTSYGVAFNPDGLEITVSSATSPTEATTSTVASKNYGIVNKSSKNKLVKVGLSVTSTEATETIAFVPAAASATNASKGEYKIFLEAIPADGTDIKVVSGTNPATATHTTPTTATQPAALAHVKMEKASAGRTVMQLGDNEITFMLGKASYALKPGESLDLENLNASTSNDVQSKFAATDIDTDRGVTGFTFGGAVNTKADWTKVTGQIRITPTYTVETADDTAQIESGTGAVYKETKPKFTSNGVIGQIAYTSGVGDDAFASLVKITAPWNNAPLDITSFATLPGNNIINIDGKTLTGWKNSGIDPVATITYKNAAGATVSATAVLKTH